MIISSISGKVAATLGGLAGGVVLVAGAAKGGSQEAALAARPETVTALCAYATSTAASGDIKGRPLTSKEKNRIESAVLVSAAQGTPRSQLIDKMTRALHTGRHPDTRSYRQHYDERAALRSRVAQRVQQSANDLCTQLTEPSPDQPVQMPGSENGAIAVHAALKVIGTPYSWGGGGPSGPTRGIGRGANTVGFDCSGLTQYAWAKAGVSIGDTTSPQWHDGPHVTRSRLQPGDLLFFAHNPRDPSTIHHVGLNIDGKRMIHSPRTGGHVEIVRWAGNPYRENGYIGAVRPG